MSLRTILRFLLIALVVVSLGALTGWYLFLRGKTQSSTSSDTARGFGTSAPSFAGALGSAYQNIVSNVFGGGGGAASTTSSVKELWQVNKTPVAGAGFVRTPGGISLWFVERSTGYVFAADPKTGSIERLTNTLMPKVYEAAFAPDGAVLERSVDASGNILTFSGALSASSTPGTPQELTGAQLPKNIRSISFSPNGNDVFYLLNDSGATIGVQAARDGTKTKRLFSSSVASWAVQWIPDGRIVLTESPADGVVGYAYDVRAGNKQKIIGGLPGLIVTPRASSTALLYSTADDSGISLFAVTAATSTGSALPVRTVAEKCVWSPQAQLVAYCAVPENTPAAEYVSQWYRGEVHTRDSWWRIDVSAGTARVLYASGAEAAPDVDDPLIDPSGHYLAFLNRADASLWMLRIPQ